MATVAAALAASLSAATAAAAAAAPPTAYSTNFTDRSRVLACWTPQQECAHCGEGGGADGGKDECTNMTLSATTFGGDGITRHALAGIQKIWDFLTDFAIFRRKSYARCTISGLPW